MFDSYLSIEEGSQMPVVPSSDIWEQVLSSPCSQSLYQNRKTSKISAFLAFLA